MLKGVIQWKAATINVWGHASPTRVELYLKPRNAQSYKILGVHTPKPFKILITDSAVSVSVTKDEGGSKTLDDVNTDFYKVLAGTLLQLKLLQHTGEPVKEIKYKKYGIYKVRYKNALGYIGHYNNKLIVYRYKYNDFAINLKDVDNTPMPTSMTDKFYNSQKKYRVLYTPQEADLILDGKLVLSTTKASKKVPQESAFDSNKIVNYTEFYHTVYDALDTLGTTPTQLQEKLDNISWLLDRKYHIVNDSTFDGVLSYLSTFDTLAVDTETTGLIFNHKAFTNPSEVDKLVGVVISGKEGESFYFPLYHSQEHFKPYNPFILTDPNYDPLKAEPMVIPNLFNGDIQAFFNKTKTFFETKSFVTFNAEFDWSVFYANHIKLNVVFDVFAVLSITLIPAQNTFPNTLKAWTKRLLNRQALELDNFAKTGTWSDTSHFSFRDLPYELVRLYACPDTDNTLALYNYLVENRILESYASLELGKIETNFMLTVAYQRFYGHYVSPTNLQNLKNTLTSEATDLLQKFYKSVKDGWGVDATGVNLNSPAQLQKLLYTDLKLPPRYKYGGGKPKLTTSKDKLASLLSADLPPEKQKYPFLAYLLEYRDKAKMLSDFTVLLDRPNYDGYLYSRIEQFLNTGRVSSKNPNYQGYNDTAKKYVTPRDGYYMMDFDYSSIESRLIASLSQEPNLLVVFQDPDTDYHSNRASALYSVPEEAVTKKIRGEAKTLNFAIPYGFGDESLAEALYGDRSEESVRKAIQLKNRYWEIQPYVAKFFAESKQKARALGYTETYYKRRRYYDKAKFSHKSELEAGNHPVQGTAADLYKLALGNIFQYIMSHNLEGKILIPAFIHDEAVFEISKDINPIDVLTFVKSIAEFTPKSFVPILIGCGFGYSWYDAKSVEIPPYLQLEMINNRDKYFSNWEQDVDNLLPLIKGYIKEHEKSRVVKYLTDPQNNGKPMKVIIRGYFQTLVKEANLDVSLPTYDLILGVWDYFGFDKYVSVDQIITDIPDPNAIQDVGLESTEVKVDPYLHAILAAKVIINHNKSVITVLNNKDVYPKILELLKRYVVTTGVGYSIRLATEQKGSTMDNPQIKFQLVNKVTIPQVRLNEFVAKLQLLYV